MTQATRARSVNPVTTSPTTPAPIRSIVKTFGPPGAVVNTDYFRELLARSRGQNRTWLGSPKLVFSKPSPYPPGPLVPCVYKRAELEENTLYDISLVMATRVDTYGGAESFKRMQRTLDVMEYFAQIFSVTIDVELIIVEYNRLPGAKRLRDVLTFPPSLNSVRIIDVGHEHHKRVCEQFGYDVDKVVPVMEFVAKNIGIRRARGRWILPQAMDTVLSETFWEFLASGGS